MSAKKYVRYGGKRQLIKILLDVADRAETFKIKLRAVELVMILKGFIDEKQSLNKSSVEREINDILGFGVKS